MAILTECTQHPRKLLLLKAECLGCVAKAFAQSLLLGGYSIPTSYLHGWTTLQVSP